MYTIVLNTGAVLRDSDGKQVAPCQSVDDPDYAAYAINVLKGAGVDLGNKAIPSDVVTSALRTGAPTMVINSPAKTGDVG